MTKYFWGLLVVTFVACKNDAEQIETVAEPSEVTEKVNTPNEVISTESNKELTLPEGVRITWKQRGAGELLKVGQVIDLEYTVLLEDGTKVESSADMKEPFPFMIGYGMQTAGWDLALTNMKVGDEVTVFVPAEYARGEKGIEGIIPPNANNILQLKVVGLRKPEVDQNGNKKWVLKQSAKYQKTFDESNNIEFYAMISTQTNPRYFNNWASEPYRMKLSDAGVIPGLKLSLEGAKRADKMYLLIPPKNAYGNKGYQTLVEPNQSLFYFVYVTDIF